MDLSTPPRHSLFVGARLQGTRLNRIPRTFASSASRAEACFCFTAFCVPLAQAVGVKEASQRRNRVGASRPIGSFGERKQAARDRVWRPAFASCYQVLKEEINRFLPYVARWLYERGSLRRSGPARCVFTRVLVAVGEATPASPALICAWSALCTLPHRQRTASSPNFCMVSRRVASRG